MENQENLYQILSVEQDATAAEIKKAYFSMVRKYPPERFPEQFKRLREAYETLSDPKNRQEYDSILLMKPAVKRLFEEGINELNAGNSPRAVTLLEKAVRMEPSLNFLHAQLARAYRENGNTGKAIKIYEELVKQEPHNASYLGSLAEAYLAREWHNKAAECYYEALKYDPENPQLALGLSFAIKKASGPLFARDTLRQFIAKTKNTNEDYISYYLALARFDMELNDFEQLQNDLDDLLQIAMRSPEQRESVAWSLFAIASMLMEYRQYEYSSILIERAHKLDPENPEIVKLYNLVAGKEKLFRALDNLEAKGQVSENIIQYLAISLMTEIMDISSGEQKLILFSIEEELLDNPYPYYTEIKLLQREYPDLYNLQAKVFDAMLDSKLRRALKRERQNRYDKIFRIYEALGAGEDTDIIDDIWEESEPVVQQPIRRGPKIRRNDPCPCGSGKKYKECCGRYQ